MFEAFDGTVLNPDCAPRLIIRHPDDQGSIISFVKFGKVVNLFVADAQFRTTAPWGMYGTDLPELDNFSEDLRYISTKPHNFVDNPTQLLNYIVTDDQLQNSFYSFSTDKSAKENTDILIQYKDTNAAHHCRDLKLSGVRDLDLPNIHELMVIYLESDRLDTLDPTVNDYPQYALGVRNPSGRFSLNDKEGCWSSTEYHDRRARIISHKGYSGAFYKDASRGVIPVKELTKKDLYYFGY